MAHRTFLKLALVGAASLTACSTMQSQTGVSANALYKALTD